MEIRTSIGYLTIVQGPDYDIEARFRGRRVSGSELRQVLRIVGVPEDEVAKVASMLRHPTIAGSVVEQHPPARGDGFRPALRASEY